MQLHKLLIALLLCAGLGSYASAAMYCPLTTDGKIRIDECKYSTNEACKEASESKRDCVADQPPSSGKGKYCLIMGAFEVCDKYQDYETCEVEAKRRLGSCVLNPYYVNPDK